jgi:ATP-dependent helicase HrpB
LLQAQQQSEREIGVDAPLVEFVQNDTRDAAKRRIGQHAAHQNAFGDIAEARAGSGCGLETFVALDAEERSEHALPLVRLICPIRAEWLLDFFPERITESTRVEWNRQAERVETVSSLLYDTLVIEESRSGAVDPAAGAAILASKAMEAGLERFTGADEWSALRARIDFAAEHGAARRLSDADIAAVVAQVAYGLRGFSELRQAGAAILSALATAAGPLDEVAPERVKLPGGRTVRVHYENGRPPWIASRLQDFFGMRESPRIARGAVPLVIHLLAPNQRPVQTTTDLAGFWERLYPQVRKELSRRYPKHRWPEEI